MKIRILSLVSTLLLANVLFAGGIVTNTNQSAQFIRTLNQNATTGVTAAYFNPAGLVFLPDGIHISISNQSIFQTKTSATTDARYRNEEWEGTVTAIAFPNIYVAYKTGNMAFAGGFVPIGGGGGAVYDDGLPYFESSLASAVGIPAQYVSDQYPAEAGNITGYSMDAEFEGTSVYYGFQGVGAYKISDMISVGLGVRYIMAKNTYVGALENMAFSSQNVPVLPAGAAVEVDAERTGSAMSFILSAHLTPMEGAALSLRYETSAPLELENATTTDGSGLFPDKAKTKSSMPAMLAIGVGYAVSPALTVQGSFNYYMNTSVDWVDEIVDDIETGNAEMELSGLTLAGEEITIDDFLENGFEVGVGAEYTLSDKLTASAGFLMAKAGKLEIYNNSLDFSLDSNTLGGGIGYMISPTMQLNVGCAITMYSDGDNESLDLDVDMDTGVATWSKTAGTETYSKTSLDFAIGLDIAL